MKNRKDRSKHRLSPEAALSLRLRNAVIRLCLILLLLAGVFAWQCWQPAHAAGGAHAVDDGFIDPPGSCVVEAWRTLAPQDRRDVLAVACTPSRWSRLQLGGELARLSPAEGRAIQFEPQAKVVLLAEGDRMLAASLSLSLLRDAMTRGTSALAMFNLTWQTNAEAGWMVHANIGRERIRRDHPHGSGHWGVALDTVAENGPGWVLEAYGQHGDSWSLQAGPRWRLWDQRADLDLLATHDMVARKSSMTLGLNLRF